MSRNRLLIFLFSRGSNVPQRLSGSPLLRNRLNVAAELSFVACFQIVYFTCLYYFLIHNQNPDGQKTNKKYTPSTKGINSFDTTIT